MSVSIFIYYIYIIKVESPKQKDASCDDNVVSLNYITIICVNISIYYHLGLSLEEKKNPSQIHNFEDQLRFQIDNTYFDSKALHQIIGLRKGIYDL